MNTFRKFVGLLTHSEKKHALILLCLMVVGMVLETLGIGLVIPLIGLMMQENTAEKYPLWGKVMLLLDNPDRSEIIILAMFTLVSIYGIKNLFLAFLSWHQARFAYGVQRQVSQKLFSIYLQQPYTFHLQRNSAQLIRNTTIETNLLTISISAFLLILTESFVMLGIATLLISIEPVGAVIVVSTFLVAGYSFLKLTRNKIANWGNSRQFHDGMRIQHLQEGLGGIKDVILLNRANSFLNQYKIHNTESAKVAGMQIGLQQMPRLALEFLAITGLALLVLIMIKQEREISDILPILGLFAAAAFRLLPSANRMLQSIQTVRYGKSIINTLHHELNLQAEKIDRKAISPLGFSRCIQIRNLSFRYLDSTGLALSNINLQINKGLTIGFVGTSGSGKSTLVDIIMGLLTPQDGGVYADENYILNNIHGWRMQIGYVPQSIFLIDDTLRRNIAFGVDGGQIDEASLNRAVKAAQLEGFVDDLELGLNTMVGERGVRLSGGQRQRIGIARALYHDPEILVLDEATSALDSHTEAEVMAAIDALHGSKTIIIVAHRLSTVKHCDSLYRIEKGQLVEETYSLEKLEK